MRIEKFIDEISTLVEKDIINGKTLKEHINGYTGHPIVAGTRYRRRGIK